VDDIGKQKHVGTGDIEGKKEHNRGWQETAQAGAFPKIALKP